MSESWRRASTGALLLLVIAMQVPYCLCQQMCSFADGKAPMDGSCAGPTGRALARIAAVRNNNYGCGIKEVPYGMNGSLRCGDCSPSWQGTIRFTGILPWLPYSIFGLAAAKRSGPSAAVPLWQCGAGEYCDTHGTCRRLLGSLLEGQPCNVDSTDGSLQCPTGLSCIRHECRICSASTPYRQALQVLPLEEAACLDSRLVARAGSTYMFKEPSTVFSILIFSITALLLLSLAIITSLAQRRAQRTGLLQLLDDPE